MDTAELLTLTNIILTTITLLVGYLTYKHSREQDFHKHLYEVKFATYQKLVDQCLDAMQRLDINSTPFVEIYDFTKKEDWDIYYEKEVTKLIHLGFDIQKSILQDLVFLPSEITENLYEFSNKCLRYVAITHHFDTGLIIEYQDEIERLYHEVINSIRKDLGIGIIDRSLQNRIKQMRNLKF